MPTPIEPSFDGRLRYCSTNLDDELFKLVNKVARREMWTRSDYIRRAVIADLQRRGLVALPREVEA